MLLLAASQDAIRRKETMVENQHTADDVAGDVWQALPARE
jgi:hypothetical protein